MKKEINLNWLTPKERIFLKDHFFEKQITLSDFTLYFSNFSRAKMTKFINLGIIEEYSAFGFRICREKIYYEELL